MLHFISQVMARPLRDPALPRLVSTAVKPAARQSVRLSPDMTPREISASLRSAHPKSVSLQSELHNLSPETLATVVHSHLTPDAKASPTTSLGGAAHRAQQLPPRALLIALSRHAVQINSKTLAIALLRAFPSEAGFARVLGGSKDPGIRAVMHRERVGQPGYCELICTIPSAAPVPAVEVERVLTNFERLQSPGAGSGVINYEAVRQLRSLAKMVDNLDHKARVINLRNSWQHQADAHGRGQIQRWIEREPDLHLDAACFAKKIAE